VRPIYRTGVPLPSRCCILYIFSTNISTEYFKHAAHSPFFSSKCRLFHNATFILVSVLFTFYIEDVLTFKCKTPVQKRLIFKNLASYIWDRRTATLQMFHFIYFFSTTISTEYFKHAAHSPFFSSKCRLFHNATFFGSCIIHILHTGCAKI